MQEEAFSPDSELRVIGSTGSVAMLANRVRLYLAYSAGILRPIEMPELSPKLAASVIGASQRQIPICDCFHTIERTACLCTYTQLQIKSHAAVVPQRQLHQRGTSEQEISYRKTSPVTNHHLFDLLHSGTKRPRMMNCS
ncbi:Hypothetical predicted protein [Xyrichtys novacula]|uniref:Uncharacterized protein n=1 Tax=Xyrichtys novacula TaxID=13765 RepID=A0AAV1G3P0_XYRNO|nr:Hypothetical predicted protein [Xyrichtys novacula]